MSRPDVADLYRLLMDLKFEFMGRGQFTLAAIYRTVKARYPELCDDSFLCSANCKQGHNHPEWRHRVRAALDQLKNKPGSGVRKLPERHQWMIGDGATTLLVEDVGEMEGREVFRLHRQKERKPRLVQRKKQSVQTATGRLSCEVCEFDFQATYGELGDGFAECHHRTPLSELREESRTTLSDLAIVCANCHRMLHRGRNLTVERLRAIVLTHTTIQQTTT